MPARGRERQTTAAPAKPAAERCPPGRLDEAIQLPRLTTDNGDHVQRIEIEIRTKERAERSGPSVAAYKLGWFQRHAASEIPVTFLSIHPFTGIKTSWGRTGLCSCAINRAFPFHGCAVGAYVLSVEG